MVATRFPRGWLCVHTSLFLNLNSCDDWLKEDIFMTFKSFCTLMLIIHIVYYHIQYIDLYFLRSYSFSKIQFICPLFLNYLRIDDFCVPIDALYTSQFKHDSNWLIENGLCPTHPYIIHVLWVFTEYWIEWLASWVLRLFLRTFIQR